MSSLCGLPGCSACGLLLPQTLSQRALCFQGNRDSTASNSCLDNEAFPGAQRSAGDFPLGLSENRLLLAYTASSFQLSKLNLRPSLWQSHRIFQKQRRGSRKEDLSSSPKDLCTQIPTSIQHNSSLLALSGTQYGSAYSNLPLGYYGTISAWLEPVKETGCKALTAATQDTWLDCLRHGRQLEVRQFTPNPHTGEWRGQNKTQEHLCSPCSNTPQPLSEASL